MPRSRPVLTPARLREVLDYQPEWGVFRALANGRGRKRGAICGGIVSGHRRISVDNFLYEASHLAWLYVFGKWPIGIVDHRNGNPDDNRIANLRDCEPWQNLGNIHNQKKRTMAPFKGLGRNGHGWAASIRVAKRRIHLGTYKTAEEAARVYAETDLRMRGEFSSALADPLPPLSSLGPLPPLPPAPVKLKRKQKPRKLIERDALLTLLSYNPITGHFRWRTLTRHHYVGQLAGHIYATSEGYRLISIGGRTYRAHSLAWFFVHNEWPLLLDHIDGNRDNNRIDNLRIADRAQNAANRGIHKNNKSGIKGVCPSANGKKWIAQIQKDGKNHYLGQFPTKEEAALVYANAARKTFGEFVRGGLSDDEERPT